MRNNAKCYMIYWMVITLTIIFNNSEAQVIYSSWTSTQVLHAVETEKPMFKRDTITTISGTHIEDTFTYKGFVIKLGREMSSVNIVVISGTMRIILKPNDEYEVIEKLLSLK